MLTLTSACLFVTVMSHAANAQSRPSVAECNQFAEIVNRNKAVLEAFEVEINNFSRDASAAATLEDIKLAASRYVEALDEVTSTLGNLAFDLDSLRLEDEQLMTYRTGYVDIISGFNDALSIIGGAMGQVAESGSETELSDNLKAVQEDTVDAVAEIQDLADSESSIVTDLNSYCGAE